MVAKIDRARLKSNNSIFILANDYDKSIHGEVICPDFRCGCNVTRVKPQSRNIEKIDGSTEQVHVDSFFRLPKGSKNTDRGHSHNCKYNYTETINKLLSMSNFIDSFISNEDSLISRNSCGKIEFRLHILMKILSNFPNNIDYLQKINPNEIGNSINNIIGNKYSASDKRLLPYLRLAKAINSLVARLRGDADLANRILLRYDNNKIRWHDYFYNAEEHKRLSEYILKNRIRNCNSITGRALPVSCVVQLKKEWEVRQTISGDYQFACEGMLCKLTELGETFINPVIYTQNTDVKRALEFIRDSSSGRYILVCSIPNIGKPWKKDDTKKYSQTRLNINIYHRFQFCMYSPIFE